MFGNKNSTGGGLFGAQKSTGGGLFGGGATSMNKPTGGGGLFGGGSQTNTGGGGGLFGGGSSSGFGGNSQAPTTGGGLFGGGTQQKQGKILTYQVIINSNLFNFLISNFSQFCVQSNIYGFGYFSNFSLFGFKLIIF